MSFVFSLAAAPTPHIILTGTVAPAACPGSAASPQAAAGHLCIYESQRTNTSGVLLNATTSWGATIFINSSAAGGMFSFGTWAVTAA